MRRKQQLGLIVLTITVTGMLMVGAGSVLAQDGNETTATNNTSQGSAGGGDGPNTVGTDDQPRTDSPITTTEVATENPRQGDSDAGSAGGSDEGNATTDTGPDVSVRFPNQRSDGTTVLIRSVTLPDGGFVAIHDDYRTPRNATIEVNGIPTEVLTTDSVIGVSSYLEPGTHENVTIELFNAPGTEFDRTQLSRSREDMVATVHRDTNGNTVFEFTPANRTMDTPYRVPYLLSGDTVRQQGPALGVGTVAVGESIEDVLGYDPNNITASADAAGTGGNATAESAQGGSSAAGSGGGGGGAVGSGGGDDDGKAKQPSDGDDGATDGGNGKAKMGDGGDGNDTADGENGKAKEE